MARTIPRSTVSRSTARTEMAEVPHVSYGKTYVPREHAGIGTYALFDYALANKHNVLITGPTGSGKTMGVLAYAALRKKNFYAVSSSVGLEPSQLFGRYIPDGVGGFVWQDGPVTHLARHGGVLLINEVNFVPDRVSTVLFSLLDRRRQIQLLDHRGEVITAHPDLLVLADLNPGYVGTRALNAALRNRFSIQLDWDYDPVVEKKLIPFERLREIATRLRTSQEISTPVGTNMLMEFMGHVTGIGYDFAVMNLLSHFKSDEKPVVTMVIDANMVEMKREFKADQPDEGVDPELWNPDEHDLTVVGTAENPNPLGYPDWAPEDGIYNVNWKIEA